MVLQFRNKALEAINKALGLKENGGWNWAINQAWLDAAIDARLPVQIVTKVTAETFLAFPTFAREIAYLLSHGYKIRGGWLVPPGL